jgi:hypothetical protein
VYKQTGSCGSQEDRNHCISRKSDFREHLF